MQLGGRPHIVQGRRRHRPPILETTYRRLWSFCPRQKLQW